MSRTQPIDVSILIVSFNTRELTLEALRSVRRETTDVSYEVIVVDNASGDGSAMAIAAEFPDVRLFARADNIGFARANNLAAREARGKYILLLNPDTVVLDRAIDRLHAFARRLPDARIWGGRTLFADGSLNSASCWGRMTLWNLACRATGLAAVFRTAEVFNGEAYGGWLRDTERTVDIVSGCFLMIESSFWRELDGFDPLFFMYGEEADLCLRAKALGARPAVTPEATIIHFGGASESARTGKMIKLLSAKASLIQRHFHPLVRTFGLTLLAAWPASRLFATSLSASCTGRDGDRAAARTWGEIWTARSVWIAGYSPPAEIERPPIAVSSATPLL